MLRGILQMELSDSTDGALRLDRHQHSYATDNRLKEDQDINRKKPVGPQLTNKNERNTTNRPTF